MGKSEDTPLTQKSPQRQRITFSQIFEISNFEIPIKYLHQAGYHDKENLSTALQK